MHGLAEVTQNGQGNSTEESLDKVYRSSVSMREVTPTSKCIKCESIRAKLDYNCPTDTDLLRLYNIWCCAKDRSSGVGCEAARNLRHRAKTICQVIDMMSFHVISCHFMPLHAISCHLWILKPLRYNGCYCCSFNLTFIVLQSFCTSYHSCPVSSLMLVLSKFACIETTSRYAILVQAVYQKQLGCTCSRDVCAMMIWS